MHKAKEWLFYPEKLEPQQLVDLGLANAVLPHDELLSHVREQALKLVPPRGAGLSLRQMKRALHAPLVDDLARALDLENEALNKLFRSSDFAEGISARIEKREPRFTAT